MEWPENRSRLLDDPASSRRAYEAPTVRVLGAVHLLTQLQDKKYGVTDGYTFMGVAITNASRP